MNNWILGVYCGLVVCGFVSVSGWAKRNGWKRCQAVDQTY